MAISHEWVRYGSKGASGLLCLPERVAGPLPGILVFQEIWGVDAHIEDVTHRFAGAGYAAFAPDLFAPEGERPETLTRERISEVQAFMGSLGPTAFAPEVRDQALAKLPEAERNRISQTSQALFAPLSSRANWLDSFRLQLVEAASWLRKENPVSTGQKVGAVGFCMGGGLVALLACDDEELEAGAIFYGQSPPLDRVSGIRAPLQGHYGSLDTRVNEGVPAFEAEMRRLGKPYEPFFYEGAPHGFFRDGGPSYNVAASRLAFARTLDFFSRQLA